MAQELKDSDKTIRQISTELIDTCFTRLYSEDTLGIIVSYNFDITPLLLRYNLTVKESFNFSNCTQYDLIKRT